MISGASPIFEMKYLLNGEQKELSEKTSVLNLLEQIQVNKDHVVVEINREIVEREDWKSVFVASDDEIEVITFMGGGEKEIERWRTNY